MKFLKKPGRRTPPRGGFMCLVNRGLRRIRRQAQNDEGVAAIEFALIFPFLLTLMLGSIEMFLMSMASRKMTRVASTVGDLVTQAKGRLSKNAIEDYYLVARHIMGKFPEQNLALYVFTYTKEDAHSDPTLAWKVKLGQYDCQVQEPELSDDQKAAMEDGNDLVVTIGCYKYQVKIAKYVFGSIDIVMKDEISLRPRQRMKLPCDDCSS